MVYIIVIHSTCKLGISRSKGRGAILKAQINGHRLPIPSRTFWSCNTGGKGASTLAGPAALRRVNEGLSCSEIIWICMTVSEADTLSSCVCQESVTALIYTHSANRTGANNSHQTVTKRKRPALILCYQRFIKPSYSVVRLRNNNCWPDGPSWGPKAKGLLARERKLITKRAYLGF